MKFRRLLIENFLAISEAELDLADRGLVLIQGANDDDPSAVSNGAGKSSLADALCWVLYGTTARGVAADAVVNRDAGKNCRVELFIDTDDGTYRVVRHRKHKTEKNALRLFRSDGFSETDLTGGTDKITQEALEKIVGCSYEVFKAAVYAGQEQMPDLPAMRDKELKVLVEEAAGTELLESAYTIARTRAAMAKGEVQDALRLLESARADLDRCREDMDLATADRKNWEEKRQTDIDAISVSVRRRIGEAKTLKEKIEVEKPPLLAERGRLQTQLDAVAGERTKERELGDALNKADLHVRGTEGDIARLRRDAEHAQAHLKGIDGKVGTPCGECGKTYGEEDLETARKLAAEKLRAAASALKGVMGVLERAREARETHAGALEAHRKGMTDVSAINASLRDVTGLLDALADEERSHAELVRTIKAEADQAKKLAALANPHEVALERLTLRAIDIQMEIDTREATHAAEVAKHELAELAVKVFAPAGVRAHILDTVTPFLNDRTAAYLGTLSDGAIGATWSTLARTAKGELKEKFQIDVTHAKGGDGFASLSGGEKRKVRVATALALQDLVAARATKPIGLFIGDEIDDALDKAGLERLMDVLKEKAHERGSVFVISHSDLRDWIDEVIVVRKSGGASVLEAA